VKTEWDYTTLANAYIQRPDYSDVSIDAMLSIAKVKKGDKFCDVGAGVAHLTLMLAERGMDVTAVEPNDAMRSNGLSRTHKFSNVRWCEGTGENTGQSDSEFDMVTFGSSFNVCDRKVALSETARILKPGGWFSCMWNHRDLNDPIQSNIELIIKNRITGYGYGTRRQDQVAVIDESGLFGSIVHLDACVFHNQTVTDCVEAWRSHATLERQAGEKFLTVVNEIEQYLISLEVESIEIPYSTNIWMARLKS
jgi:ubiquinone/menaquinone biosynthesis C-methylase UbiE